MPVSNIVSAARDARRQGDLEKAISLLSAAAEAESATDDQAELAKIFNALADLYLSANRLDLALQAARAGLAARWKACSPAEILVANDMMMLARVLEARDEISDAIDVAHGALKIYERYSVSEATFIQSKIDMMVRQRR